MLASGPCVTVPGTIRVEIYPAGTMATLIVYVVTGYPCYDMVKLSRVSPILRVHYLGCSICWL